MKERLYLNEAGTQWLEVCDCGGELQIRLHGELLAPKVGARSGAKAVVRARVTPAALERIAAFAAEQADDFDTPADIDDHQFEADTRADGTFNRLVCTCGVRRERHTSERGGE